MAASEINYPDLAAARREPGRSGRWWMVAACVCVGWFYVWTARNEGVSWNFGQRQTDYYNLLVDGFLDGHLYLKTEVSPELLKLADPYNPANRAAGIALHDASMYRGRYYSYFGAGPVVTLMLPFRVLTGGTALPLPAAVLTFTQAGFLASVAIFMGIQRRYFPDTGGPTVAVCVLALGTASMGPLLVLRGSIWELLTSSGYFYAMVALWCVGHSLHAKRRVAAWFAAASLSLGLAVACRPTYVYTGGLLAVPLLWWWCQAVKHGGRAEKAGREGLLAAFPWKLALAGVVPIGAVGLVMVWYNYARFGSPTEFGVAYQFSGVFEAETRHFRWSYLPLNVHMYWVQLAEWTRYFPFFHRTPGPAIPMGHLGYDDVYGALVNVPLVWLALCAPLAAWRRSEHESGPLKVMIGAAAMISAGMVIPLAFFYAAMMRYGPDYVPVLVLLAAIGALALQRWARVGGADDARIRGRMRGVNMGCGTLAAFSIFFAVMLSFEAYGNLRRQSPRAYARLAAWGNYPSWWWEKIAGANHGPVEVELRWPTTWPTAGMRENLVHTGAFDEGDCVFVHYEEPGRVRIGYAHDGGAELLSRVMAIERSATRRTRVEMGSLYPPEGHPFFSGMKAAEIERLARRLRVEFGDEVLLDSYQRFHTSSPTQVEVGVAARVLRVEKAFSGEIVRERRDGEIAVMLAEKRERTAVCVRLSEDAAGTRQPLFTAGSGDRTVVWYAVAQGNGIWVVGCAAPGEARAGWWKTAPVASDSVMNHEIEVMSLARPGTTGQTMVKLDGVVIGTRGGDAKPPAAPIILGANKAAVPEIAPTFGGIIHRADEDVGVNEFDTVRLTRHFPVQRKATREPLVVTGETGRGAFLFLEYLEEGRVRFGLDHWGKGTVFGAPQVVDFANSHTIEIGLESFPSARRGTREPKRIQVKANGREVWTQEARLFGVAARSVCGKGSDRGNGMCAVIFWRNSGRKTGVWGMSADAT